MKNPKLILQICNLINGILLLIYVFKILHLFSILNPINGIHLIIGAAIIYIVKRWFESKYDIKDPLKFNKITKLIYYLGSAAFTIGILFKIMHWPYSNIMLIVSVLIINLAFVLSIILNDKSKTSNPDIIDDI